jgi:uncharacterized protein (DUF2141 family)
MLRYSLLLSLLLTSSLQAADIHVTLRGEALVAAPLYAELVAADQTDWGSALRQVQVQVSPEQPDFYFLQVPEGDYAIRLFLDLDGDGRLALSRRGMPLEPVGFSPCAVTEMVEPLPSDCGFVHDRAVTPVVIELIQLRR